MTSNVPPSQDGRAEHSGRSGTRGRDRAVGRLPRLRLAPTAPTERQIALRDPEVMAARVAPDAPASEVVKRIGELNGLSSSTLNAGQTLIAPVG